MSNHSLQDAAVSDPRQEAAKPDSQKKQEKIPHPGLTEDMAIKPDHGEESYRGLGRLEGRTALITGADSGIGKAVAIAFAREGADIALSYLPDEEKDAADTVQWIEKAGKKALKLPGDLQQEKHCEELVSRTVKELGKLDLLINVAAFQMSHEKIDEMSTEEFDRTFKTNVYALFWLCRSALKHLPPGGAIVNTTSIQAFQPSPNLLAYASTKAAIANFTKGLSELAMKQGVRVNGVAPGPVWTPLIPATMPEEKVKQFGKTTAFERAAQPVELATLFVFLASNEARFATGEIYAATGGQTPL